MVLALEFTNLAGIGRGSDEAVTGPTQGACQKHNIVFLIVDDQDSSVQDVTRLDHGASLHILGRN